MILAGSDGVCVRCIAQASRLQHRLPQHLSVPRRTIRSVTKPRPQFNKYNNPPGEKPLLSSPAAAYERKKANFPLRTGLLAIKRGMTALYDPESGIRTACTVVQLDRLQVISHKTTAQHGYSAVQLGSGLKLAKNVTRPLLGHFAKHRVSPKRHVVEFRVRDDAALEHSPPAAVIGADWLRPGQFLDVQAVSKGKGFAGGMKRHGFKGQPASHGNSLNHRTMGSAGSSQGGGSRVFPGKKMAGRMGGENVTVTNVQVLQVDNEKGVAILKGESA